MRDVRTATFASQAYIRDTIVSRSRWLSLIFSNDLLEFKLNNVGFIHQVLSTRTLLSTCDAKAL
jgi:hypothetical protein